MSGSCTGRRRLCSCGTDLKQECAHNRMLCCRGLPCFDIACRDVSTVPVMCVCFRWNLCFAEASWGSLDTQIAVLNGQVEAVNMEINTLLACSGKPSPSDGTGLLANAMQQLHQHQHMLQQQLVNQLQLMVGSLQQQQQLQQQLSQGPIPAWGGQPMQVQPQWNEKGGWQKGQGRSWKDAGGGTQEWDQEQWRSG